jgi:hypothetical protein
MAGKHPDDSPCSGTPQRQRRRLLAAQLFNETWRLMGLPDHSQDDISRMIGAAHASRFHWSQVPGHTPAHLARGDWLISRVYAELRRAEPALYHARLVLATCQQNGIGDWDLAFAYEALARAHAVAGERGRAREYTDQALAAAQDIAQDPDRELLLGDLRRSPASAAAGRPVRLAACPFPGNAA